MSNEPETDTGQCTDETDQDTNAEKLDFSDTETGEDDE